jgi:hypothetical protein
MFHCINETFHEEKETDEKLTKLAGDINAKANQAGESDAAHFRRCRDQDQE